jgi:hypothetical protein
MLPIKIWCKQQKRVLKPRMDPSTTFMLETYKFLKKTIIFHVSWQNLVPNSNGDGQGNNMDDTNDGSSFFYHDQSTSTYNIPLDKTTWTKNLLCILHNNLWLHILVLMNIEHLQLIVRMMELMKKKNQSRFYPLTTKTFQHWSTLKWTMRYLN